MRPRFLLGAWAALLTACGSSPGTGLFGGEHGIHPVPSPEAGTPPEGGAGGKVTESSGGKTASTGGAAGRPAGGNGGTRPSAGGARSSGGASGGNDPVGNGGATGTVGGTNGTGGGSGGTGTGGSQTVNGGSAGATPHSVPCGATPCMVGSTLGGVCCLSPISIATMCLPTLGAGCANGGTAVSCDDAADCMAGEICCADSAGNQLVTVCLRDCKDGVEQLCRTDAECRKGGGCEPFDMQPDFSHCK